MSILSIRFVSPKPRITRIDRASLVIVATCVLLATRRIKELGIRNYQTSTKRKRFVPELFPFLAGELFWGWIVYLLAEQPVAVDVLPTPT